MSVLGCIASLFVLSTSVQQGGNQGPFGGQNDGSAQTIEGMIRRYLNGPEEDTIVTPGDPVEYPVAMKAGQVVIGEARSDAFDPALQIVDAEGKELEANDDRYPGDQRPLLFWRAPADGTYKVRVRSFRDREGGKTYVRLKTYDVVDLSPEGIVEQEVDTTRPFLARIPMRKGQIKEERIESQGQGNGMAIDYVATIAPGGLPDIGLGLRLQPALYAHVAPVSGDYYVVHTVGGRRANREKVRLGTREIVPKRLAREGASGTLKVSNLMPAVTEIAVRKGEFLQIAAPETWIQSPLIVAEHPALDTFDLGKPETNPFHPNVARKAEPEGPAYDVLPGRTGDPRLINLRARRDTTLWVTTRGSGQNTEFSLVVRPAARDLVEGKNHVSKLRIAEYDHWAFDAKPGDVMNFSIVATPFREVSVVRDPDLEEIRHEEMALDQIADTWRMIVQKPGRYWITVSSLGDGGSGEYSISRRGYAPREFSKGSPAKGEISNGEVQVWRFTAQPNDPLFVRWKSTNWRFEVAIYDAAGRPAGFQRERISPNEEVGILTTSEPRTYIVVLTGTGEKAGYSIDLAAIPKT